ncbi:MAG TPA: hypothetical protein VIA82_07670 [Candidatus Limnocylindria bacterium]|jgi:hypothetical protein
MTNERPSGYRGALPERNDALAKPWVITVIAIFILIFVLAALGFPSKVFPRATAEPQPSFSFAASGSAAPSASGE